MNPINYIYQFKGGSPTPVAPPPAPSRGQSASLTRNNLTSNLSNRKGRRSTILTQGQEDVRSRSILGG